MLLTVRDSDSARAVKRAHKSSGRTTWIRGDLGFPLADVCRVGTTGSSERRSVTCKCTEVVKGSIHDYVEGTGPPRSAPRMTQTTSQPTSQPTAQATGQSTPKSKPTKQSQRSTAPRRSRTRSPRRSPENSDVLVSAVVSTYLLTHLHHVLQRAEYTAVQEGRGSQAANYAQLRKVLCMDARSMEDASALGQRDEGFEQAA